MSANGDRDQRAGTLNVQQHDGTQRDTGQPAGDVLDDGDQDGPSDHGAQQQREAPTGRGHAASRSWSSVELPCSRAMTAASWRSGPELR